MHKPVATRRQTARRRGQMLKRRKAETNWKGLANISGDGWRPRPALRREGKHGTELLDVEVACWTKGRLKPLFTRWETTLRRNALSDARGNAI